MRLGPARFLGVALAALSWAACAQRAPVRTPSAASVAVAAAPAEEDRDEAVALYEEGRCAEALPLLEALAAERPTGALLYRLAYCQRTAGRPEATATQQRALAALELEFAETPGIETAFYLSNTQINTGHAAEARGIATQTTGRVERGELNEPATGAQRFQLGKLYADQDLDEQARRWYAAALDAFAQADRPPLVYVRWASRYLAEHAFTTGDYGRAADAYGRLADAGGATRDELDRLACARTRLGRYAEARDAWKKAELADPAEGDRARYAARLAGMAADTGTLPATDPQGRAIAGLTDAELEAVMGEQPQALMRLREEAAQAAPLDAEQTRAYQERIAVLKTTFLAAALEYSARGLPIRETAFVAGYAPLIFQPDLWGLPPAE